jgi:hypothetical protein
MKISKKQLKKIAEELNKILEIESVEIKNLGEVKESWYLIFTIPTNFGSAELSETKDVIGKYNIEYDNFLNVFAEDAFSLRVYLKIRKKEV